MLSKLFVFNPTCEMAVANGHGSYRPPAHLRQFEIDLAAIPLWLGGKEDYVLVDEPVSEGFINQLINWGVSAPQFITSSQDLGNSISMQWHPWGWSPALHQQLKTFGAEVSSHSMLPWQSGHKMLLSRYTGLELATIVFDLIPPEASISIPKLPQVVTSAESVSCLEVGMMSPVLLKTPWSASGRGLFKIRDRHENAAVNTWVLGKLKQQGALMAEPWLEKLQDLSFHFWVSEADIQFLGTTYFKTDKDGRFEGCYTSPPIIDFMGSDDLLSLVGQAVGLLQKALSQMQLNKRYNGPVGVDGLFFRTPEGQVKLHPCIEVNLRYTMGLVNLFVAKHVHPESYGYWTIQRFTSKEWHHRVENNPPCLRDGYWHKGVFMLTPPPQKVGFMAFLNLTSLV